MYLVEHRLNRPKFALLSNRSEGLPARDIWSLGVMVQGSGQMRELLGRRRRRRRCCRRRWRPPATTPRDINIEANMDRTIHI